MTNKIIRTICWFTTEKNPNAPVRLDEIRKKTETLGYQVQTLRIVNPSLPIRILDEIYPKENYFISAGTLDRENAHNQLNDYLKTDNLSFNVELKGAITMDDLEVLTRILREHPEKTFLFNYTFSNVKSTPFFPAADFEKEGYSIGLQPVDLSEGCNTLEEWLVQMRNCWTELNELFKSDPLFLGIDSSVAPMWGGAGSLVRFINRLGYTFEQSVTTDIYLRITRYIKNFNPNPVGLCGIMFPCLEDFLLADEYDKGRFSIERNIFLSLHSGLGIDTYPVGLDEKPERILQILQLLSGLSTKYHKPLSIRLISDGKSSTGDYSCFNNQYLKEVTIRPL